MSIATDIADRLANMPEASAVSMRVSINTYFDVIQGLLDNFLKQKNLDAIYITCTIPSAPIINALQMLEIDLSRIYFVDCVSNILMSREKKHKQVYYVESPTMLENIIIKVEYLHRKTGASKKLVLLDSINSLAIHNNPKILSEFLHILVNNLRAKNTYTVILSLAEQSSEEISNMTTFVCDDTIIVEESV